MTVDQDAICEHLAHGKSLVSYCKESGVSYTKVMIALRHDENFQQNYAYAREQAADFHVDEVIEIADTEEDPAKARVRVDARKWVAAKMKPKKYGDSTQIKHADANGENISFSQILGALDGRTAGRIGDTEAAE